MGIITIYIVILISFVIWQIIGISWIVDICPDKIFNNFCTSLGFGWAFIFIGSFSFCCSLCCAVCDSKEYGLKNDDINTIATHTQVEQHHVPGHSVVTGLLSTEA